MHVTQHRLGWPENRKNVPGVACSVYEAVVHYDTGSSWLKGSMKVNLKHTR